MAGGCPLLLSYTTPGERLRGCSFAEGFKSYSDLVANSESITGSPTVADGVCTFNGTSAVVYKRIAPGNNISASVWFKTSSLGAAYNALVSSGIFSSGNCFNMFLRNNGELNCDFYVNGVAVSFTAVTLGVNPTYWADNNWHNVILAISRTGNFRNVYYDGVQVLTGALSSTVLSTAASTYPLTIGAQNTGVLGNYFTGQIRDVKIWDQALDVAEAVAYYNNTMNNYMSRVLLNYPMTTACHDSVNGQTLDIGPQQRHLVFRAGNAPTKDPARRGYLFAATGGNGMTSLARTPSTSTARTLFQILGSTTAAYAGDSKCAGLLQADGTTLANCFSNYTAPGSSAGDLSYYWQTGGQTSYFYGNCGGSSLLTATWPSVGGVGKALANFRLIASGPADKRTSNDDSYVVVGRGSAGFWTSVNSIVRAVMLWDEELNVTQMYDLHARMAKQMNDV